MIRALNAEQARSTENRAVAEQHASLASFMASAGEAVASQVGERVPEGRIVVLCGPGNNAGDGWVAARELHAWGRDVRVFSLVAPTSLSGIAADAASAAVTAGVSWSETTPSSEDLASASVVVDALLGVGARGALRGPLGAWVDAANASGAYMLAVDVPTGVDSDTGAVEGSAIRADATVTFTAPKLGLVLFPGAGFAGEVIVAQVGVEASLADLADAPELWAPEEYAALLPLPAPDAHKNSRGRLLVIAGSGSYPGAAVLAARGAMRSGAGYITLAVPEAVVPVAQAHLLAVPVVGMPQGRGRAFSSAALEKLLQLARDYDAVVLGPGLTLADGAVVTARGLVQRLDMPLVIDADGLNALVGARGLLETLTAPTVLTPHPGELGRLLGISTADVQRDRVFSSAELAMGSTAVVLKGAGTVISGEGRRVINTAGTPALATAGTGDVLAGVVGALLAQGLSPLEAGALGAFLHGRAGEAAAAALTPMCVTAEDVPDFLPDAVGELLDLW